MAYYPTEELAAESTELFELIAEALSEGKGVEIPAHEFLNPASLATKIRTALRAAEEYPKVAPKGVGLKSRVIVKVDMRNWCCWIVPREKERKLSRLVSASRKVGVRRAVDVATGPVDCSVWGLEARAPEFWIKVAQMLQLGRTEFLNMAVPEDKQEIVNQQVEWTGYELDVWEPPERVTFRLKEGE